MDDAPSLVNVYSIVEIRTDFVIVEPVGRRTGITSELRRELFADIVRATAGDRIMEFSDGSFDLYIVDRGREERV